jgi:hypothetical protein
MTHKNRLKKLEEKASPKGPAHLYVINPAKTGEQAAEALRKRAAADPDAVVINVVYKGGPRTDIQYPSGQAVSVGIDLDQI